MKLLVFKSSIILYKISFKAKVQRNMEDTPPIVIRIKRTLTPTGQKAFRIDVDNLIYSHWTKKQEKNTITYKNRMGHGEFTINANSGGIRIDNQTSDSIQFCDFYAYMTNVESQKKFIRYFLP